MLVRRMIRATLPRRTSKMPYAEGRLFNDADSHVMETHDWMTRYADPGIRERLAPLDLTSGGVAYQVEQAVRAAESRKTNRGAVAEAEANLMLYKGWKALGAFDPAERSQALDLLGFNRQLVFTTFALSHFWGIFKRGEADPNVVYG